MRLICLNAWGGRLAAPLLDYLRATDPDVLCLQEVTFAPVPGPEVLSYRGADKTEPLEQRSNLFAEVAGVLDGHWGRFCPAMQGWLSDGAGRDYRSQFGLATFVRRGLVIGAEAQGFVHGSWRADGWGQPPVPRVAHCLRLGGVTIAQMHGLRDPAGKHDTPARAAQVARLIAILGEVRQAGDKTVLCGDFNLLPDSATFVRLADLGLRDLVVASGCRDTRTSHYRKEPRLADYMLVSPEVEVRHFDVVVAPEISDHRALMLEFD